MVPSSPRILFGVLAAFVALTRPYHFASVHHLPDASLAAFFLVGAWISGRLGFIGLLALAFGIDAVVMAERGGVMYCVTPGYLMRPVVYGAMWLAGRSLRTRGAFDARHALWVALGLFVSTSFAFAVTSGGYYLMSYRFPDPSLAGFLTRAQELYPAYLLGPFLYVTVALIAQALLTRTTAERGQPA